MKKMLEYQKLDMELNKLKKSSLNSSDRANLEKLKGIIVEYHNKGFQLESGAKSLIDEYAKLKDQYDNNYEKVKKLTETDISTISLDKVDSFLYQVNSLSSELFLLERNINIIITKIKESLKNFEVTKNNIIKAKEKYNQCKAKCDKDVESIAPKIKELETRMKTLEGEIPSDLFDKYKSIKNDKIFPVYVAIEGNHCCCGFELPTSKFNKLKTDGSIICEQCHRVIYQNKN